MLTVGSRGTESFSYVGSSSAHNAEVCRKVRVRGRAYVLIVGVKVVERYADVVNEVRSANLALITPERVHAGDLLVPAAIA